MGTSAQAQPTLACITLWRIKHPMYTAKKKKKKTPAGFLAKIDTFILDFLWKFKESRVAKRILKKNKVGLTRPSFKTYYKAALIKALSMLLS